MNKYIPPLRLILTTRCNANCDFCHKEGSIDYGDMPEEMIWESIAIANEIDVSTISLTGGEPTLLSHLSSTINSINELYPSMRVKLTTNGYKVNDLANKLIYPIDTINLSLTSLNDEKNLKSQNVYPHEAIKEMVNFPALNKNLNILVRENNIDEIYSIIDYCLSKSISIDFLFELKDFTKEELLQHSGIVKYLRQIVAPHIEYSVTPSLAFYINKELRIRLKHTSLKNIIRYDICKTCPIQQTCYEKICAIRVHPYGMVTPCLNCFVRSSKNTIKERIIDSYSVVMRNLCDLSFLYDVY